MTPQERQLVDELFDKLARLETSPRDRDAERAIADGLSRAPNAVYALVQTALVQDEALKRADARIRELSGEDNGAPANGGFLDTMRAALGGSTSRGSVPSVSASGPDSRWNTGGAYAQQAASQHQAAPQPQVGSGGSFLGTAAASAAGVIGGALLMNSISSMFSHRGGTGQAFAGEQSSASPWSDSASNSDMARDAGLNDIGSGGRGGGNDRSAGLFGSDNNDNGNDDYDVADSGDFGGDDGGGDTA
ncbi:MAG TPA: DUF2076 domain-containing protein [Pseudolabrys sp.]|jgi:hypothetical protein